LTQMETAERVMCEDREVLRKLAEGSQVDGLPKERTRSSAPA